MQVPYLARHCRVLLFDGRGNGLSDRPESGYAAAEFAADALAVMDATGTERAPSSRSRSAPSARCCSPPSTPSASRARSSSAPRCRSARRSTAAICRGTRSATTTRAGRSTTATTGCRTTAASSSSSSSQMFNEPHSTKLIEDCVGWGLDTTPETLIDMERRGLDPGRRRCATWPGACSAPARDPGLARRDHRQAARHRAGGGERGGAGDARAAPGTARTPATPSRSTCCCATSSCRRAPAKRWARAAARRRKRALYVSSPIGLGHAQRDAAIADELRKLHPELEIDWLAQHPVTAVLEARGERIHPASALLASESRHIESESAEHDLHASRRSGGWTRSCSPTSWSSTTCPRGRLRPVDRRRGVGARLLPAREPGAEARGVRVADRLRRLAADGGRRRARGVPDRRLQRRDDRAHRALPAGARPRDLRRRRRRRRAGPLRPRAAGDPRLDRRSTTTSPATSPASTRPSSPTASGCGPSSATGPASRCAS